jgi:hypothetical protein
MRNFFNPATAAVLTLVLAALFACGRGSDVSAEDAAITDRTGETWPLDRAVTLGFRPGGFEHGLGKHAIKPLDDSRLIRNPLGAPSGWTYDRVFVLYDKGSESLWHPDDDGLLCIRGEYFKRKLPETPSEDTTWGEWSREHPDSRLLRQLHSRRVGRRGFHRVTHPSAPD